MRDLVSVILPCFNAQNTIVSAIRSVLSQTYSDFELHICDDASTDRTLEYLKSIRDPRIILHINDSNVGQGLARDRCIAAARGRWIAFIDADDIWKPERLERILSVMPDTNQAMVADNILQCHDVNGKLIPWRVAHTWGNGKGSCTTVININVADYVRSKRLLMQPVIPTSFIRDHHIHHRERGFGEDAEFFLEAMAAGLRLVFIPKAYYLYRITPNSSTSYIASATSMRQKLERCRNLFPDQPEVQSAFEKKLEIVRATEVRMQFLAHIRALQFLPAIKLTVRNPLPIIGIFLRLPYLFSYHLSRLLYGGKARGIKWSA